MDAPKLTDFIPRGVLALFKSAPAPQQMRTQAGGDVLPGMGVSNTDDVVEVKGIEGYRKMRRDAEVAADTDIRLAAMIPGLQILPADGDEDAKKSADFCESVMKNMRGELEYVIRDQMLDEAIVTGFFVGEPREQIIELAEYGKVVGLESIYVRPSEGFNGNIEVDEFGTVTSMRQDTLTSNKPVKPSDVLYWAFRGQPWNPYGRSIYHAAWDFWKLKQALTRLFSEFSTVNASGIKEYVIKDDDFLRDSPAAYERLKALAGRANIVRKKTHELKLHIPPGTAGYHFIRGIRELCNVEIRKAILYDESINAEGMRTGSRASREVSENVMYAVMQTQGYSFCTAIAEQLFRRILDRNGFENLPVPRLVPEPVSKRDADPAPILQSLTAAYSAGVITTIPDEVRDQILRQTLRPMGVDYVDDGGEVATKKDKAKELFAQAPPGRTRADLLRMKREAIRAEAEAVDELVGAWKGALPDLKKALNTALFDRDGKWKTKKYSAIRKAVEDNISTGGTRIRKALTDSLLTRYDSGRGDAESMIKVRGAVNVTPLAVDPAAAREMLGQRVYLILQNQYGDMSRDIYYILENAINGSISEREAMAQISAHLESAGISGGRATTIVSTSLSSAYNEGRMSLFNKIADPDGTTPGGIIGYQFSATMDDATTELCQGYDGMFFRVDDPSLPQPPLHYACRSILLPVFTGEEPWGGGEWADPSTSKAMSANIPEGFGGN